MMGRLKLAWRILFNKEFADKVRSLEEPAAAIEERVEEAPPEPRPARNEAITLLETLQREARFVDFIKEPIDSYSDPQIGAAVREIHRDCGTVLERIFVIRPVLNETEGAQVQISSDDDAGRIRLTGNVTGDRPTTGKLAHHGWEAQVCELPEWTGSDEAARVLAPAEVEV